MFSTKPIFNLLITASISILAYEAPAALLAPVDFGTFRDQNGTFGTYEANEGYFENFVVASFFPSTEVEDRAVIEFDISGYSNPVETAILNLSLVINNGDTSTILVYDIFSFAGDSVVDSSLVSDYSSGTLANSFSISNEAVGSIISIDLTSEVNDFITNGDDYAGFRIQFNGAEPPSNRFTWLSGKNDGLNDPTLSIAIPEPSTRAAIWLTGGIALLFRRKPRRLA